MYRFSIIRGIECEQKDISTEWRIETVDGVQHIFYQFTLADTEYQVLHLIWMNAHQQKDRLPVNELFKRTMRITNKPKGSAGSGSLAESESTHLTNREGTMTHLSGQSSGVAENTSGIESETASLRGDDDEDWKNLDEGENLGIWMLMWLNSIVQLDPKSLRSCFVICSAGRSPGIF
jgi:hypothetical protein